MSFLVVLGGLYNKPQNVSSGENMMSLAQGARDVSAATKFNSLTLQQAVGEKPMDQRCREKAARLLAEYEAPAMDPAIREELDAFMALRQSQISPAIA